MDSGPFTTLLPQKETGVATAVSFFYDFHMPPYGGGNQFLLALRRQFERTGVIVHNNTLLKGTRGCLFNSFNFDFEKLQEAFQCASVRRVHRVDGPVSFYRGHDDGTDRQLWQINREWAEVTIFQSQYSLQKHEELGMDFRNPVMIPNAVDPEIFYPASFEQATDPGGKIKLIATSWSDNPKKGGAFYAWLDKSLNWERYEMTFVGRVQQSFRNVKHLPACDSHTLASILRSHDVYLTASEDDPCSNALLEALACGLPAVYRKSGGHPEIVRDGGVGFCTNEDALTAIEEVGCNVNEYRKRIRLASIQEVAQKYLEHLLS